MSGDLLIIGAGGHAKAVIGAARASAQWSLVGLIDDAPSARGRTVLGVPVVGPLADVVSLVDINTTSVVVAVGDNQARRRIQLAVAGMGALLVSVVHPTAVLAESVTLGGGCVVMAGAVINPGAVIGDGVIVNTGATVDHDCIVEDFAHVAPGVHLCGGVCVGERALVGVGACAIPGICIGADSTVGAGAAVVRDVPRGVTVVGVPAREI